MTSNRSTGKLKFSGGSLAAALLVGGALMLPGSAGPSLALPVSPAAIGTAADGIDSVITMARRGGGARAGGGARVSHSAGVSRSARVGHGARVSHAKVNRTTNVRTRTNVNVNRVTNVNVGRGLVRPWVRRPYYGTIVGGVALGAVIAAGAIGVAPAAPADNMCWFWSDSSQVRGYWDYCTPPQ